MAQNSIKTATYTLAKILGCSLYLTNIVQAQLKPSLEDNLSRLGAEGSAKAFGGASSQMSFSGLQVNPASGAFKEQYTVGLNYIGAGQTLGAGIVDTKSSIVGGGLYYIRRDTRRGENDTLSTGSFRRVDQRGAFSIFGRAAEEFAVGASIKYSHRAPDDEAELTKEDNWNGDIGLIYDSAKSFALGLSVLNILDDDKGLNPRSVHFGGEYRPKEDISFIGSINRHTELTADSAFRFVNNEVISWGLGVEYRYQDFSFRSGYHDKMPWDEKWINVGIAYVAKVFGVHYSFNGLVSGPGNSTHDLGVDVRF